MPANFIHGLFHRVEKGWDPILPDYAEEYAKLVSNDPGAALVGRLAALSGGLAGKRVLDLGGGPGQYSVLFAKYGARVTWHDISREYEKIAKRRAEDYGVCIDFSLGYLEEAKKFGKHSFDLVFCRVCWYYCKSDRAFGSLLYGLVKPGGIGYIECNTPTFSQPKGARKLQSWLNERFWWKIGHPMPPHGRIAKLMQNFAIERLELDYSSDSLDVVLFAKKMSAHPLAVTT